MVRKNVRTNITWFVLLAFTFLATSGLVATANMDHTSQHHCPFSGVAIQDCTTPAPSATVSVFHHIDGFKSVTQTISVAGIAALIALLTLAVVALLPIPPRLDVSTSSQTLLRTYLNYRPPTFFKLQRWLALHSKRLMPHMVWVCAYAA